MVVVSKLAFVVCRNRRVFIACREQQQSAELLLLQTLQQRKYHQFGNLILLRRHQFFTPATAGAVYFSTKVVGDRLKRYPKVPQGNLQMMKIDNNEHFKSLFTPELIALEKLFKKHGYEIRMAGGAVRDLLIGKKPQDIDFATTATPDEMKDMFEREGIRMINMKGEKHGTITARINDKENFEITTLRIDVVTDGRHAEVEFTKNWELDAGRRDLTINSMFLDFEGNVYDYFNGAEDLEKRLVRFVGDPRHRIQEDYLRILRYFRFYGKIATTPNSHEPDTLEAIRENAEGLGRISGERIWVELRKILTGNYAGALVTTMVNLGIAEYIGLPKEPNLEEFKMVIDRAEKLHLDPSAITVLTALLREEKEGKDLHARLKLSAFERDLCLFLISHREVKNDSLRPYQEIVLLSSQFPALVLRSYVEELLKYQGESGLLEEFRNWESPKFPVNGHMLMERGIKGRIIGPIMTTLKERWLKSDFTLTKDELLQMLPDVKAGLSPSSPSPPTSKKERK